MVQQHSERTQARYLLACPFKTDFYSLAWLAQARRACRLLLLRPGAAILGLRVMAQLVAHVDGICVRIGTNGKAPRKPQCMHVCDVYVTMLV